jgi:hypothetical protein
VGDRGARRAVADLDREQRSHDIDDRAGSVDAQRAALATGKVGEQRAAVQADHRCLAGRSEHVEPGRPDDRRGGVRPELRGDGGIDGDRERVRLVPIGRSHDEHSRGSHAQRRRGGSKPDRSAAAERRGRIGEPVLEL